MTSHFQKNMLTSPLSRRERKPRLWSCTQSHTHTLFLTNLVRHALLLLLPFFFFLLSSMLCYSFVLYDTMSDYLLSASLAVSVTDKLQPSEACVTGESGLWRFAGGNWHNYAYEQQLSSCENVLYYTRCIHCSENKHALSGLERETCAFHPHPLSANELEAQFQ